ncbi:PDZ domain-containing protein [Paenibacillus sediminis]|uniref:PDZ domain-containing protein n=1 Tax=Paenibacillus sediminis TaxID=664909 RepID=A0ABS4H286_9BACL|nr:PDZ domain-containing protein [Paenibacillus sediminis]MBP1936623.1 hypothetical protein [Paenibacillus sediminis]
METALEWLWNITEGLILLLTQPFYYIAILFIILQYRRQVVLERKLFHVRLHGWGQQTWRTFVSGLASGICVSLVMVFLGISLTTEAIILIWVISLILMLFRVRYLCFAYTIGLLGVIQAVLGWLPEPNASGVIGSIIDTIAGLDIPALLVLVALLHIAEAVLVRGQGASFAGPLFYEGKRGKLVGGYQMQSFWPVPLFLLIPAQTTGSLLPWTPLFGGAGWNNGFTLMALPVLIGFTEMTQSMLPREKTRLTSKRLLLYSIVLLVLALLSHWWSPLIIGASLASFVLHELLVWLAGLEEQSKSPIFVHPAQGLRVLAVLPGSPAAELGISAGETIRKVNGMAVNNKEQLHLALRSNSAFCKLEVQNVQGELKFLQRGIYAGEHHQLGIILAPDDDAEAAVRTRPMSIFNMLLPSENRSKKSSERLTNTEI